MTVRTNAVQTCDRCEKPFNERYLKSGDEVPAFKQSGVVVTETTGSTKDDEPKFKLVASFDDLCPDCRKAVDNLIAKIKLDSKPKKKSGKPAKKRGSKKKEEKPEVPEYTEGEADSKAEGYRDPEPASTDEAQEPPAEETTEPAETPGPDGEPAATTSEPQESQEAAPAEETEQAEAAPETTDEAPAEEPAEESATDGGNGAEAASGDDDSLMTDPETGDVYDKATGEVVSKGSKNGDEKHPF